MKELKIYKSPWMVIKLLLGCSIFVGVGIWIVMEDASNWIGWANISFFGLGFPFGLYQLLDKRPQIIINEFGIFDRTTHNDFINWELIQDAYINNLNGQKFICLVVDESFEHSKKKGRWFKKVASMNKALGFQELNIMLGQIKIDKVKFTAFILAMSKADKPNREDLMKALPDEVKYEKR